MSFSPPSLVTVPRFDSDQVVQELMNTIKAQDPDKGELQELESDEDRLDAMVHDLEVVGRTYKSVIQIVVASCRLFDLSCTRKQIICPYKKISALAYNKCFIKS